MKSYFWSFFGIATALKALLIPAYHSTDFEVHRNWLAITYSLPLNRWYEDATSEWTLDYPPFFAYFEWILAQLAKFVDPQMLEIHNLNYISVPTKYFQRITVICTDIIFAIGVMRCLRALRISKTSHAHFTGEVLLLCNVGLIFVDHIHFQYNGFLFGFLLLSISFLLQDRFLLAAFTFAILLNLKHIFLYMAPAFAVYFLKFYCLKDKRYILSNVLKLAAVGLLPFVMSFGPFYNQLPQIFGRLFPFKRGLTHAYWAPNFWALYNTADKVSATLMNLPSVPGRSTTSGLVQEHQHVVLPSVTPQVTFILSFLFMLPILIRLMFYTAKGESRVVFLRALVLCAGGSFLFGWHVHEKAILMCLIPICLLCLTTRRDAKYAFLLSAVGYISLFPLLFETDLLLVRYSLYLAYMGNMYGQLIRLYNAPPDLNLLEFLYLCGFLVLPLYEHVLSPLFGLNEKLPFMPLLLTSFYCSIGILYLFISYYIYTLGFLRIPKSKSKLKFKSRNKPKLKLQ